MTPSDKARAIWGILKDQGYHPIWTEIVLDGSATEFIAMGFDMLGNPECPWSKAFKLEAANATPQLFIAEINAWKRDKREELQAGHPVPVVQQAIRQFGRARIDRVLGIPHYAS